MSEVPVAAHVAAASLNQTVGDWAGNQRRIIDALKRAREAGARLLVLPEMCIPGYSLGDRLMMSTAFGKSGLCILHMIKDIAPELPVYFLETGYHFQETLGFFDQGQHIPHIQNPRRNPVWVERL